MDPLIEKIDNHSKNKQFGVDNENLSTKRANCKDEQLK